MRQFSFLDRVLSEVDQSLRTAHATAPTTERPNPAANIEPTAELTDDERKLSAKLMRVNHSGEVAAQGLYRGQALTAKDDVTRKQMERSAMEENDHLNWCEKRLTELNSPTSHLNPLWYWGSFSIGALAGTVGDKWSLGFVKETEDQVEKHLNNHISHLPATDLPSMAILQKMKEDEIHHGQVAVDAGAVKLPWPIRKIIMPLTSKVMTKASFHI